MNSEITLQSPYSPEPSNQNNIVIHFGNLKQHLGADNVGPFKYFPAPYYGEYSREI